MIIKTIRGHKSRNPKRIEKLLRYIYDEDKMLSPQYGKVCFSKQFLRGFDVELWVKQILECDQNKSYNDHIRRVVVRHEVCSFHAGSTSYLLKNRDVLKTIQRKYMERRSQASGISVVHYEEGHIHIHFAFCATNIDSTSNRMNNQQFRTFKKDMEDFQRMHFPELHHSEIDHNQFGKKKCVVTPSSK